MSIPRSVLHRGSRDLRLLRDSPHCSRSFVIQFWPFYKMAMELVDMCNFDNQEFFDTFEVTVDQATRAQMQRPPSATPCCA